jgi:polyisoprenoid-binding protein YceI
MQNSMRLLLVVALGGSVSLLARSAPAAGQELHVDLGAANTVRFISRASIEEFEGVTDQIDGYVLLDGPTLTGETGGDETELYLEVDLASLDTGIGLRNRHMRNNYLEVEDFPYASYSGAIVRSDPMAEGGHRVTSRGSFTVHGVSRDMEIPCDVTSAGDVYRATCSFQVLLSDHDIEIPRIMFLKLANEIRVELDFVMTLAAGGQGDQE